MIDWEDIARAESADELREAKLWLFQENIRLENERRELAASREKFSGERARLTRELEDLNRRMVQERKRLKEENLFFEKKMAILQEGFRQLDLDRQSLERQKKALLEDSRRVSRTEGGPSTETAVKRLFANVDNSLALRKRYRDLVKIFHPDNLFGDAELAQVINREYLKRKEEI